MSKDEFENREAIPIPDNEPDNEGLGYVNPAPIVGDYIPSLTPAEALGVPGDIAEQARIARALPGVVGLSPGYNIDVQSVFDTRPVNATDFHVSTNGFVAADLANTLLLSYTVPNGKIALIRGIRWQFTMSAPNSISGIPDDSAVSGRQKAIILQINGNTPADLIDNNIPAFQGVGSNWQDIFIVVGPSQLIEVVSAIGDTSVFGHAEIRGTLLLSRGLPYPFEIGSKKEPVSTPPKRPAVCQDYSFTCYLQLLIILNRKRGHWQTPPPGFTKSARGIYDRHQIPSAGGVPRINEMIDKLRRKVS